MSWLTNSTKVYFLTSWGWLQFCVCIGINITQSNSQDSYQTSYLDIMATCLLMASEYKKGQGQTFSSYCCTSEGEEVGEQHTQNIDDWTHTWTCLSSFWAVFQCAISSAERAQSSLWNLAFMTAWSVPYSNYRWQHTLRPSCINTHTNAESLANTQQNIGGLPPSLIFSCATGM